MSDKPSDAELTDEELDAQLREIADQFIDLANQQAERFHNDMPANRTDKCKWNNRHDN